MTIHPVQRLLSNGIRCTGSYLGMHILVQPCGCLFWWLDFGGSAHSPGCPPHARGSVATAVAGSFSVAGRCSLIQPPAIELTSPLPSSSEHPSHVPLHRPVGAAVCRTYTASLFSIDSSQAPLRIFHGPFHRVMTLLWYISLHASRLYFPLDGHNPPFARRVPVIST